MDDEGIKITPDQYENPPPWIPIHNKLYHSHEYSYWITIWIRINCTHAMAEYLKIYYEIEEQEKFNLFMNAHLECIRYLDKQEDPRDSNLDIDRLKKGYKPLGKSHFDNDRNFIEIESFERKQIRPYPLQIIREHYPELPWTPEEVKLSEKDRKEIRKDKRYYLKPEWEKHKGYMECLYIVRQIRKVYPGTSRQSRDPDFDIQDNLWYYHTCFLDYLCGDDPILSYKNYPHDNRSFTGWDLPDTFHVLMGIPFWGKQTELSFPVGKFTQKSLPFAGARRQLINQTDGSLSNNDAFWKLFSQLFYCMLLDLYPHFLTDASKRCFDLRRLTRLREIARDRKILKQALVVQDDSKEKDKGCYIVFTAFRLWILLQTHDQKHFLEHSVIQWDLFQEKTVDMACTIRSSKLEASDCFADARETLSKVNKNPKTKVYRFRKSNMIEMILEKTMQTLEKELYSLNPDDREAGVRVQGDSFPEEVLSMSSASLHTDYPSIETKTTLLNLLVRVPKDEWLTTLSLSMMRVHGNVSEHTIYLVQRLMDVYYDNAKPKDFDYIISLFEVDDFKVVCWYLQVISLLNKIDFDFITEKQVAQIDYAIANKKYVLLPGEYPPECSHDVFFTICCQVIKTLMNSYDYYGHENIAYDLDNHQFICSKAHKKAGTTYNDAEALALTDFERERKRMRDQRKDFNHIPCTENPVLRIPMRGYVLIYNKNTRYMHCPSCGSFHKFVWSGWQGETYACQQCRFRQKAFYYTCHKCMIEITEEVAKQCNKEVCEPFPENGDIRDAFRKVYFCRKHFKN